MSARVFETIKTVKSGPVPKKQGKIVVKGKIYEAKISGGEFGEISSGTFVKILDHKGGRFVVETLRPGDLKKYRRNPKEKKARKEVYYG